MNIPSEYQQFYDVAMQIARVAGKCISANFSMDVITNWKADGTPLTKTDTDVNSMVIETIKKHFPTHSVMGEEESHEHGTQEYVWSCDPIDGTIPFSHGLPNSTFSLALVYKGDPIIAVVCEPFQKMFLSAIKGNGAYLNETKKLTVNTYDSLESKVIHVDGLPKDGNIFTKIIEKKAFACSYLSCVYGAKQVATGHFVGSIFYGKNPWDVAAVKLIIEEAGGKCTSLTGIDQTYDKTIDGFVASNGILHTALLTMVAQAKK